MIAPSFAELVFTNATNNRLLRVALPEDEVAGSIKASDDPTTGWVRMVIGTMNVTRGDLATPFDLPPRYRRMFLEGLEVTGLTLNFRDCIESFSEAHWAQQALGSRRGELYHLAPSARLGFAWTDERLSCTCTVVYAGQLPAQTNDHCRHPSF